MSEATMHRTLNIIRGIILELKP